MAAAPEQDVIDRIDTAVAWAVKSGASRNVFKGKPQPVTEYVPARSVWVQQSGGPEPLPYSGPTPLELREPSVQVMTRSAARDYPAGKDDADEIRDALHHQTLTADYIDIEIEGEPIHAGEDDEGRHLFSINFRLQFEE